METYDTFTTATGKELQTDYVVAQSRPPFAYLRVIGKTFVECATIFSNPEETKEITYNGDKLTGFTTLLSIADEGDAIKIQLTK